MMDDQYLRCCTAMDSKYAPAIDAVGLDQRCPADKQIVLIGSLPVDIMSALLLLRHTAIDASAGPIDTSSVPWYDNKRIRKWLGECVEKWA
jgi:hypothetical protein